MRGLEASIEICDLGLVLYVSPNPSLFVVVRYSISVSLNERVMDFLILGSCTMTTTKSILVEFGGGLELLFSNQKSHNIGIPTTTVDDKPTDMKYLILWLKDNLLKDRQELFLDHNTV